MARKIYRPVVLIIRDGWGANPYPEWNHANAVHLAPTPVDDRLRREYPHVLIATSGRDVGLPDGTMGNSEVGHQNLGAGRVVEQEIMRITGRIEDGTFFTNPILVGAFDHARRTGGNLHLMGLCSDGQVHSDLDHLFALLDMVKKQNFPGSRVFIHAFTDGRDTPPTAGLEHVARVEKRCAELGINPVASVCGRYYAMDRDHRWERVEAAYDALTGSGEASSRHFPSARHALEHYYENPTQDSMRGDEFITPCATSPGGPNEGRIRSGDAVIFFNFRGDRPRELTQAFTFDEFPFRGVDKTGRERRMGFPRERGKLDLYYATMTDYEKGLPVKVAFGKPPGMEDIFGAYVARKGLTQFRSAETEKFPHVTFFFNDYRDEPFEREDRRLVQSPRDVATYDEKPHMSAPEVTEGILEEIASNKHDVMVINYANGDMVGHTGNLQAAIQAVQTVDECVGRVVDAVLEKGGALIVTADHGNCEQMIDPNTGGPHTAHTTYPVELIVVADDLKKRRLRPGGRLADVAPTLLELLNLEKPQAMTGESLLLPE